MNMDLLQSAFSFTVGIYAISVITNGNSRGFEFFEIAWTIMLLALATLNFYLAASPWIPS